VLKSRSRFQTKKKKHLQLPAHSCHFFRQAAKAAATATAATTFRHTSGDDGMGGLDSFCQIKSSVNITVDPEAEAALSRLKATFRTIIVC
jgi:hypothetical protein